MEQHKRNLFFLILVEVGWGLGFGMMSSQILMPVFLQQLGAGAFAISLIPAILAIGHTLPQFLTPYFTAHVASLRKTVIAWHLIPSVAWLPVPLYFFLVRPAPPFVNGDIAFFLAAFAAATCTVGFAIPLWLNYVSRVTHHERWGTAMGTLFSMQMLCAAAGAWAASFVIGKTLAFPLDYALCYLLAPIGWAVGTIAFLGTKEEPRAADSERKPFREYFQTFFALLRREPRMRRYLIARACVQVYPALLSFYANHAIAVTGATAGDAARMSAVFLLCQMVGCYAAGRLGERFGHLHVTAVGNASLLLGMAVVFFATSLWHFYLATVLGGIFFSTFMVSHVNWLLRFVPQNEDKTLILSMPSVLLAPAMLGCPLVIGWVVGEFSYGAALLGSMAAVAAGVWLAARLARDEATAEV